ncbi:ribonuclease III [Neobittarella massiliensis]|uniref:Ribonuclease 3 n=2 Tax=Oscillospiraceae TaxID=216572 RepID=A0A8J6M0X6_9FIRM|nr:ribonuclease III [Neobittarella massiliensis]MBC3515326.1 ribonuclease III [Neobittarella massiliensis]SCJ59871.1 Ribonuclease 3 [uncultured Anaerotruncus sp.]
MESLEKSLHYSFKDRDLLHTALTHSSFANERGGKVPYNERLEFLGDAVLSIVVSDYIFKNLQDLPEGELTRIRATLVCEKSLCDLARAIHLGNFLYLGRGEDLSGGRDRPSILADAFEAVIAAIYLDGGMEAASAFILRNMGSLINNRQYKPFVDYKTQLQEIVQQNPEEQLQYVLAGEEGPDHAKVFTVQVHLNSNVFSTATGRSKKVAEQNAAKEALRLMGYEV